MEKNAKTMYNNVNLSKQHVFKMNKTAILSNDDLLRRYGSRYPLEKFYSMLESPFILLNASETQLSTRVTDWERKDYPFTVMEFVARGAGTVEVEDKCFHVKEGDVYILPSHTDHKLLMDDPNDAWEKKFFVTDGPLTEILLEQYKLKGTLHVPGCGSDPEIEKLFDEIFNIFNGNQHDMNEKAALAAMRLIQRLARHAHMAKRMSPEALRILYYLNRNVYNALDLDAMCKELGMSRSSLIRHCKKEFDTTPYNYHILLRVETAKKLLAQSESVRLFEIAGKLKFTDQYHFSRVFKQKTGVNPSEYRRSLK